MTGIYKITNNKTNLCYIGQAIDIKKRWREHCYNAFYPNAKDYMSKKYIAIREFGLENFSFEVLEECNEEQLNDREQYWILYFNSYYNGYNENIGGLVCWMGHESQPIKQFDLDGNLINIYKSGAEAARHLGKASSTIRNAANGYKHSAYGYQWRWVKDCSENTISPYIKKSCRAVNQFDLQGNLVKHWNSIKDICSYYNCILETIETAILRKGTLYGFKWVKE